MNRNIMAVCLLFSLQWISSASFGQQWNGEATFNHVCNYDFDVNRQTGATIKKSCSFLIDVSSQGTGRFVFLDAEYGDKFIYTIQDAAFGKYTDGTDYLKLQCKDEHGLCIVFVSLKTNRKGKQSITKLAIVKPNTNEGTLFSN